MSFSDNFIFELDNIGEAFSLVLLLPALSMSLTVRGWWATFVYAKGDSCLCNGFLTFRLESSWGLEGVVKLITDNRSVLGLDSAELDTKRQWLLTDETAMAGFCWLSKSRKLNLKFKKYSVTRRHNRFLLSVKWYLLHTFRPLADLGFQKLDFPMIQFSMNFSLLEIPNPVSINCTRKTM